MAIAEFEEAFKRLAFEAEVGGWYKEDSTVPVRIGDLYAMFYKLKELNKAKELLLNAVNPFASKMTAQEIHTAILDFLQENK